MRRAIAAIIVCSLGVLVAPLPHSPPAALQRHDAGDNLFNWAAAEYGSGGIPICNSGGGSNRARATRISFASSATRAAAAWLAAQASAAGVSAATSPSVAGEPLRAPPVCSSIEAGSWEL